MKKQVSGLGSRETVSWELHTILSDFEKDLGKCEDRYSEEFADAIKYIGGIWSLRSKMKAQWEEYCGGSLAYNFGSLTAEHVVYVERRSGGLLNWVQNFFSENIRPDVTHEMLESDWDKLLESVLIPGSVHIDKLSNSRPYMTNSGGSYNYIALINNMVYSLVDGANIEKILGARTMHREFVLLLEKVDAVELTEVKLEDSSLALIHRVKTYF